jgi:hypothetical protein
MLQELATACQYLQRHGSAVRYLDECIRVAETLAEDNRLIRKLKNLLDDNAEELAKSTAAAAAAQQRPW